MIAMFGSNCEERDHRGHVQATFAASGWRSKHEYVEIRCRSIHRDLKPANPLTQVQNRGFLGLQAKIRRNASVDAGRTQVLLAIGAALGFRLKKRIFSGCE